jgi:N utilization substance protein B
MISRRLLRVKVLQILYAHSSFEKISINAAEKELFHSLQRTYDLYFSIMLLLIDVVDFARSRIEIARNKRMPTYEDVHPNTRFVDNQLIEALRDHPDFNQYISQHKLSWVNYPELIKDLFKELTRQQFFINYLEAEKNNFESDKQVINKFLSHVITDHQTLQYVLEEQSIYWTNDLDFVVSMVSKTIKSFANGNHLVFYPQFKNEDDVAFTKTLFRKTILKKEETRSLIQKFALNWDFDRIAFIDVLIMQMALTEAQEFGSIPVKVTINEYLEIAKSFSTVNSNSFINGILDKAIAELKNENKIVKTGRGLME